MAEKIKASDLIDKDVLAELLKVEKAIKGVTKSTADLMAVMQKQNEVLKKGADNQKTVADNVKKNEDNTRKLSDVEKEIQKIEEKHYQVLTKMVAARSEENRKLQEATEKAKQENKIRKESETISKAQALSILALNGSYKQIQAALSANILKYQSLTKEQRENSKIGGELIKTIKNQDKALKDLDSNIGKFGRNVGNYKSAFTSLTAAFGVTGGLYAFANVLKSGFNEIKTFDKAMSELKSVAGATNKEFNQLRNSALELGAITPKTATEVANLQTEFAKLGFTTPEILKVTAATIDLSVATGSDLATAANNAGSTLRAFQLPASEMPRILDVMAKGFATTALDIGNYNEAIKYVAPVAKAAGFSIEEVTAMLGKLSDAGIKGSMAGTGLRRIFLEVAKAGGDPKVAFDKLAKSGLGLAEANDEVGDRAQTALLVLSAQKNEVNKLTESYQDAKGSLKEMADIMQDNLAGDVTKATSAWSGFILGLDSGNGVISRTSRYLVQLWTAVIDNLRAANMSKGDILGAVQEKNKAGILEGDISEIDKFGGSTFIKTQEIIIAARENDLKLQREQLTLYNQGANKIEEKDSIEIQNLIEKIEFEKLRLSEAKKYIDEKTKISNTVISKSEEEIKKDKEKSDNEKTYAKQREMYVKGERQMLEDSDKEDDERLKKQGEAAELKMKLDQDYYEEKVKSEEEAQKRLDASYIKDRENYLREQELKRQIDEETTQLKIESANAVFDIASGFMSREIQNLEENRDKEIKAAGDNTKKKERIEAEYQKKIGAIKRRQAIAEKVQGVFNIGISTAIAIMKNTAQLGTILAAPINAWTRVLAGLQIAAIMAQPIPKFFKGVRGFKGGPATVGDPNGQTKDSFELVETPKGSFLTPNKATEMLLPKGTNVYSHRETVEKLNSMNPSVANELVKGQNKMIKALSNQKHNSTVINERGARFLTQYGNSTTEWINKNFR